MPRGSMIAGAALVAAVGLGGWMLTQGTGPTTGARTPAAPATFDVAAGEALYQTNCASCHGANLEGQPDWQSAGPDGLLPPPPHDETGHTWHHADNILFDYVKLGGEDVLKQQGIAFDSGMPGFGDQLTDAQIWDILSYIKSTWPDRERAVQADRSAAAQKTQGN